jgi:hypothetical protein
LALIKQIQGKYAPAIESASEVIGKNLQQICMKYDTKIGNLINPSSPIEDEPAFTVKFELFSQSNPI